jgi:hypothetical protein
MRILRILLPIAYALVVLVPASYLVTHRDGITGASPPTEPVFFKDVGPMQCEGGLVCWPQYETVCIRATGECRYVNDPRHNIDRVNMCWDRWRGNTFCHPNRRLTGDS